MQEFQTYRAEIDQIDYQIIELLAKRFKIVKKVGDYKKKNNIPPLQPVRWQDVLNTRISKAKDLGIDPNFIQKIWNEVHDYSLELEKKSD